jgi:hypothetical protein
MQETTLRQELLLQRLEELQTLEKDMANDNLDTGDCNDPGLIGFACWNSITRPVEESKRGDRLICPKLMN